MIVIAPLMSVVVSQIFARPRLLQQVPTKFLVFQHLPLLFFLSFHSATITLIWASTEMEGEIGKQHVSAMPVSSGALLPC